MTRKAFLEFGREGTPPVMHFPAEPAIADIGTGLKLGTEQLSH